MVLLRVPIVGVLWVVVVVVVAVRTAAHIIYAGSGRYAVGVVAVVWFCVVRVRVVVACCVIVYCVGGGGGGS